MTLQYLTKRKQHVPTYAIKVADKNSSAVVYLYEKFEACYAIAFEGKKHKPTFHLIFGKPENRPKRIAQFFERVQADETRLTARKAKENAPHNIEVGHIFATAWGYDQTNVNFYQVVELKGKRTAILRELNQINNATLDMQGTCTPALDSFLDNDTYTRRISGDKTIKLSSGQYGRLWDGRPMGWTSYA